MEEADAARRERLRVGIRLVSCGMLLVYVLRFVLRVAVDGFDDTGSLIIPLSLGVAYCGIVGSHRMHRDVLSCFYICCLVSIGVFGVNAILHVKDIVLAVQRGEEKEQVAAGLALGLEAALVMFQASGAKWGRELVRDHLDMAQPAYNANNIYAGTFSFEYVQELYRNSAAAARSQGGTSAEVHQLTIDSIPAREYRANERRGFLKPGGGAGGAREGSHDASGGEGAAASPDDAEAGAKPKADGEQKADTNSTEATAAVDADADAGADAGAGAEEEDPCVICQEPFIEGDMIKELPCFHIYHAKCLDSWLERRLACPMCNAEVPAVHPDAVAASEVPPSVPMALARPAEVEVELPASRAGSMHPHLAIV